MLALNYINKRNREANMDTLVEARGHRNEMFARRATRPTLSLTRRRSSDGDAKAAAEKAAAEEAARRPSFEPFLRCASCVCVLLCGDGDGNVCGR